MALTRNRLIANLAKASDSAASSSFLAKGSTEANYRNITWNDVTLGAAYSEVSDPTNGANATLDTIWNFNNTLVASNNSNTATTSSTYSYGTGKESESLTLANSTTVSFTGADFGYTSPTSISFWYKASSFAVGHVIVADGNSTASGIYNDASGNLGWFLNYGPGNSLGFTTLSTGTWYHMVLVLGGGLLKFYVNGTQHLNLTGQNLTGTGNYTFRIGYSGGAMGIDIDQVRVYNGEISSSDVTTLYNESFEDTTVVLLDSADVTSIVDSAYIQARQTSGISSGLDSAGITSLIDSNYVVARAASGSSGYGRYNYTATAGQTVFQDSDNSGAILSYTSGGIMVFYNGVMLKNTADWEGTDGSSVTLVEAADAGANVSIHKWRVAGGAGGASGAVWYGDRALISGARYGSTDTEYYDITTTGNATDFGDLNVSQYEHAGAGDGTYAVFAGGAANVKNEIQYFTTATTSNASDFGDLTVARKEVWGMGDGTYALFAGGYGVAPIPSTIDYITVATTGNAIDFGDLSVARWWGCGASDGTYGLSAGGNDGGYKNTIDYVTFATTGNASDFGDLSAYSRDRIAAGDDGTYAVFCAGYAGGDINIIDYVTVATAGNATDFGDTTITIYEHAGASNDTRCTFAGGASYNNAQNVIQYVTTATPSNATDFGDLLVAKRGCAGASGSPS